MYCGEIRIVYFKWVKWPSLPYFPRTLLGTTNSFPPSLSSSHANANQVFHSLTLFVPPSQLLACNTLKRRTHLPVLLFFTPHKTEHSVSPVFHFFLLFPPLNISTSHHMAAIVHHGLQSHLESQHAESIALKLRLPSSKPPLPQLIDLAFKPSFWDSNSTIKPHNEENNKSTPSNPNSWSFLEALSNITKEPSQNQTTYVHPQQKRSSLSLSPKSLQLCTENLGNESGSDSGSDSDENSIDMLSSLNGNSGTREQAQQRQPRQRARRVISD